MTEQNAAPPSAPLGPRILEGTSLFLLGQAAVLAVNLLATPFLVHRLGPGGYALYTLMWTVCGYLMLLVFGTGDGVQKFTAEFSGREAASPLGDLLRSTLLFQLAAAVVGGVALYLARFWVAGEVFGVGTEGLPAAGRVFAWVAAAAPSYFALQFGVNVLYGGQLFRNYNVFQALQAGVTAVAACGLLAAGKSIEAVAAAFFCANTLLAAASLWAGRRFLAQASEPSAAIRPEFLRFSAKRWANYLLWVLTFQLDRVFIGAFLPLSQMGYYVVSSAIIQKLNMLCGAVAGPAFPLLADLHGRGETERLERFYLKVTELALAVVLPLTVLAFALIPQFFGLWLGPDFSRESTWPFRFLLAANLAYFCTFIPNALAVAKGAAEIPTWLQVAKLAVLLALWPLLIPRHGIKGAALAVLAAEWLTLPLCLVLVHRRFLATGWGAFLVAAWFRPGLPALGLGALALALHGRIHGWLGLLCAGSLGLALYWAAAWCLLDKDAKDLLASWVKSKLKLRAS
ncbi:MAG: oligosaccharide flippase family protein [Elusimicrobiota bacterium]|jgi:O-antigen/teichoic acid export membrane protein